jgi:transposase-like protein
VPQDRQGRFSTELFERYQRSEKALVAALAEMHDRSYSVTYLTTCVSRVEKDRCLPQIKSVRIDGANPQELGVQ